MRSSALSSGQREALEALTGPILVGLIRGPGATRWSCRLCNTGVCGVETRECPVTRAAYERFATRARRGRLIAIVAP